MQTNSPQPSQSQITKPKRLRALIEIVAGQIVIFPIAGSDAEADAVLDAFREATQVGPYAEDGAAPNA